MGSKQKRFVGYHVLEVCRSINRNFVSKKIKFKNYGVMSKIEIKI